MRVVVRLRAGAAYKSTPCVLHELGAEVIVMQQARRHEHQQGSLDAPGAMCQRCAKTRRTLHRQTATRPRLLCERNGAYVTGTISWRCSTDMMRREPGRENRVSSVMSRGAGRVHHYTAENPATPVGTRM